MKRLPADASKSLDRKLVGANITKLQLFEIALHPATRNNRAALERILADHRQIGVDRDNAVWVIATNQHLRPHERSFTHHYHGQEVAGVHMPQMHPLFFDDPHAVITRFTPGRYFTDHYNDATTDTLAAIETVHTAFQLAAYTYTRKHKVDLRRRDADKWTISRTLGWPLKNARYPEGRQHLSIAGFGRMVKGIVNHVLVADDLIGPAHDDIHGDRIVVDDKGKLHFTQLHLYTRPYHQYYDRLRAWGHMLLFADDPVAVRRIVEEKVAALCAAMPAHAAGIRALWQMRMTGMLNDTLKVSVRLNDPHFKGHRAVFSEIINGS
ncbi:MAG: hypothetical protein HY817_00180 [Candidatus Abawacabacteria bacterium]|nr:hypothetical protein [Candidatus Abawacabacteria bacterium]